MDEVTQEQFDKELADLAERNWKVKQFLEHAENDFNRLSPNIKRLIDIELGIERKVIMIRKKSTE